LLFALNGQNHFAVPFQYGSAIESASAYFLTDAVEAKHTDEKRVVAPFSPAFYFEREEI